MAENKNARGRAVWWLPVLLGIAAGPILWWLSGWAARGGHGTFVPYVVAFPYSVILSQLGVGYFLTNLAALLQLPLYGILVGYLLLRKLPMSYMLIVAVAHLIAVIVCFQEGFFF